MSDEKQCPDCTNKEMQVVTAQQMAQDRILQLSQLSAELEKGDRVQLSVLDEYAWHVVGEGSLPLEHDLKRILVNSCNQEILTLVQSLVSLKQAQAYLTDGPCDDGQTEDVAPDASK